MKLIERVREQLAQLELDCPVLWEPVRPAGPEEGMRAPVRPHDEAPASEADRDRIAVASNN